MLIIQQFPVPFTKLASGQVARKKPLLQMMHLKAHMEFWKKHLNYTAGMWRNILWTDETKIELFVFNSKHYVCMPGVGLMVRVVGLGS